MFRNTLVTSDLSSACTSATGRQPHDIRVSNRYPRHHRVLYILLYSSMHFLITTVSGTSPAVGPYIVHRNRKRSLLSQSTLREEFVEKKYQVYDIEGLLTILVQVNLSSSVERV